MEHILNTTRIVVSFLTIHYDIHHRFSLRLTCSQHLILFLCGKAFSHFTFEASCHQLIVVDIQGVGDLYTDPQIHTSRGTEYGGEKKAFFDLFNHVK